MNSNSKSDDHSEDDGNCLKKRTERQFNSSIDIASLSHEGVINEHCKEKMQTHEIMCDKKLEGIRKHVVLEHLSKKISTGLIMNDRPEGLKPKNKMETAEHLKMYNKICLSVKKEEKRLIDQRVKEIEFSYIQDQRTEYLKNIWEKLLNGWDLTILHTKIFNKLLQKGIPTCVRPTVWELLQKDKLSVANSTYANLLTLSEEAFYTCKTNRSTVVDQIKMDLDRTFSYLKLFACDGALNKDLFLLLHTFTLYNPDLGYVQGMGYVGGILLIILKPYEAFNTFINITNSNLFYMLYKMEDIQVFLLLL